MIVPRFTESVVEDAALAWLEGLGYEVQHGPALALGEPAAERSDPALRDVVLEGRLRQALARLNPDLPEEALQDAFRKLKLADAPSLVERNRLIHKLLVDGVPVEYRRADGSIAGAQAQALDFENPDQNDWLAVNQFTVSEGQRIRRPDVIVFVNGIPLSVLELKNAADDKATIWMAIQQLQNYQVQIPNLFAYNAAVIGSDGVQSRIGTLGASREWFKPWRTIEGADPPTGTSELQMIVEGVFEKRRFLDLIRYFIVFEEEAPGKLIKKMAGYHQFHAVNVAVEETIRASKGTHKGKGGEGGDKRVGVVWHTQGSGKSLSMAFYSGRIILHPEMENPTLVVLTDRNDLDDQLFGTFARCKELLRQPPVQAKDRHDLRKQLSVSGGGVVFTTIQKFFPEEKGDRHPVLSNRRNIVVMADEAHRSQYGFGARLDAKTGEKSYGFAEHVHAALPEASFIGFTGTPVELQDRDTKRVFGDYISIYDIKKAVADQATVPIYYENRLAKLELDPDQKPKLDPEFEEVTEGEEVDRKEKLKSKWAQLEAVVGSDKRIDLIARDLVAHFNARQAAMEGKAMIVCMSRRICVELYAAIRKLRPEWHDEDDTKGQMKVVMTASASDHETWQQHSRNKTRREALANRFRDPKDPFKVVLVRDMWLTGFDAPSLHTMYLDKPMRGHTLMQAIARVNRVFKEKPGGLVVDYLGIADELKKALATYTEAGGAGETALDMAQAVEILLEKYEICRGLFHGFGWEHWTDGTPQERLGLLTEAQEHVLAQQDGRKRLLQAVTDLSKAFALAVPHEQALELQDDVAFFQAVKAVLTKHAPGESKSDEDLDQAVRQIVSKAIVSDEVVDIFAAAGLKKPDISILSDEFLAEVQGLPHRNLAVETLRRLLLGEIKTRSRKNAVQARSFSEMLEQSVRRYQNRAIEAAQVIEELIQLAKDMRRANERGEQLGLSEDELAFYDALETNGSAREVLGEPTLKTIARELVDQVRKNVTIDWTLRENVQANLRVIVKRILRKHGYPPDLEAKATQTVLEQAALLSETWAVTG